MLWLKSTYAEDEKLPTGDVRLFHACSIVDDLRGYDQVLVSWYVFHRENPVALFDTIVSDYQSLTEHQKQNVMECVNALFTEQEIASLEAFLVKCPFLATMLISCDFVMGQLLKINNLLIHPLYIIILQRVK